MTGLTQLNETEIESAGLLNLAKLAESISGQGPVAPSDSLPKPVAQKASEQRQECQPAIAGGLFAALHPECSKQYLEQFHLLRTQLLLHRTRFADVLDVRTLAVMSSYRGEGKSFTATNLAATLANASGQRVLLIDANPEGVELPTGIDAVKPGLGQALEDPEKWEESVYRVRGSSLSLMPRGRARARSIDFAPLPRLLAQLRRQFEWVVMDGTAFAASPDAEWLTSVADGTLLVVQKGKARFGAVQEALKRIPQERMVGVVFNERKVERTSPFKIRIRFAKK